MFPLFMVYIMYLTMVTVVKFFFNKYLGIIKLDKIYLTLIFRIFDCQNFSLTSSIVLYISFSTATTFTLHYQCFMCHIMVESFFNLSWHLRYQHGVLIGTPQVYYEYYTYYNQHRYAGQDFVWQSRCPEERLFQYEDINDLRMNPHSVYDERLPQPRRRRQLSLSPPPTSRRQLSSSPSPPPTPRRQRRQLSPSPSPPSSPSPPPLLWEAAFYSVFFCHIICFILKNISTYIV
ncbi:hypothetical protein BDF21DRAFT_393693 [Thamnidium elegans]|nr:hypothetical protein BDF21DRAFT_393693 [Thamnidium elegans]